MILKKFYYYHIGSPKRTCPNWYQTAKESEIYGRCIDVLDPLRGGDSRLFNFRKQFRAVCRLYKTRKYAK